MLSGQPQYLLVSGLFVTLLLACYLLFTWNAGALLPLLSACMVSFLLAAPAIAPFMEANLSGMAYTGNHLLVGSSSYWKFSPIGFSQLFCNRLTGFVGTLWYSSSNPTVQMAYAYESFPISFGAVGGMAALAGSVASLRFIVTRRRSCGRAIRAAAAVTTLALLALLLIHNLSSAHSYPWSFRFVNLSKYSAPVLALLFCLTIPSGLCLFAGAGRLQRLFLGAIAACIPAVFLVLLWYDGAKVVDRSLLAYSLLVTFLPVGALLLAGKGAGREGTGSLIRFLSWVLIGEVILLSGWGTPFPYEWARIAAIVALGGIGLFLKGRPNIRRRSFAGWALVCAAALVWVRLHSAWGLPGTSIYEDLRTFSIAHQSRTGYVPRLLTSKSLTRYPYNSVYSLRSMSARCPIAPVATQALLFDYIDPDLIYRMQRKFSFLGFDGIAPPGTGELSWSDLAENPGLLDLLGVDYLVDLNSGWLPAHQSAFKGTMDAAQPLGHDLFLLGRGRDAGRVYFSPRYETEAFSVDGWNIRRRLRAEARQRDRAPIVEIDPGQVPGWDGFVVHQWFEDSRSAPGKFSVSYVTDKDGVFEASVTADGPGLLVYKEQFWPGWKATVNGVPVPDLRVDSVFQGILLKGSGTSLVRFQYVGTLSRDLKIALVGLLLGILIVFSLRSHSRLQAALPG